MSKPDYPKLHKAVRFTLKAHKKQDRDGEYPLPYISHPMDVLNRVRYVAGVTDEDLLCVAVLHDTLEQTNTTEKDLVEVFGQRVASLVRELTRQEPDETTMRLSEEQVWRIRTDLMLSEIDRMSDEAKIVKLADRCSNLQGTAVARKDKLARYIIQSRLILEHISRSVSPPLWDHIQQFAADRVNAGRNGAANKPVAKKAATRASTPKKKS